MRTRKWSAAMAAAVAAVLMLSSCTSNHTAPKAKVDAALLTPAGGKHVASGAPIRIGLVNDDSGAGASMPEVRTGVQAAFGYVNDYLGGIAGRPVVLDSCDSKSNSASAAACASQMIADRVVGVLHGPETDSGTTAQTLMNAGIPVISTAPASAQEMAGSLSFSFSGGAFAFAAALGQWMAQQHYHSSTLFAEDAPGGMSLYQMSANFLRKLGINTTVITVAPGTADVTPQMTSALSHHPDAVWMLGDAGLCLSFMRAYRASGSTAQVGLIGQCTGSQVTDVVSLSGAVGPAYANPLGDNTEARLYRGVLDAYAPGTDPNGLAYLGYTMALGTIRAVHTVTGEVTPAAVAAAMRAAKGVPLPIADDVTFACDGKQIPPFPAPCSDTVFIARLDAGGNPTTIAKLHAANLMGG
ncbi:ABC transporter substrate-binding protein [Nocardia miyunensis]|uniref:ABC transporter substrate-binding protein n=1 Tax=Nocardia miyunensis TaxID=282684 RepID=UPI00082D0F31|nr:ABC transporter substrate-binding protein [Nocardia miyunensis]